MIALNWSLYSKFMFMEQHSVSTFQVYANFKLRHAASVLLLTNFSSFLASSKPFPHLLQLWLLCASHLRCLGCWQGIKRCNSCVNWSPRNDTTSWQDEALSLSREDGLPFEQEVTVSGGFHFLSALISRRGRIYFYIVYCAMLNALSVLISQEIKK